MDCSPYGDEMDSVKRGKLLYAQAHFRLHLCGSGSKPVKLHFFTASRVN